MKVLEFSIPYKDPDCRVIGAGVMPFAIFQDNVYFLLGKEAYDGRYGVFGGRLKPVGVQGTAIHEFHEETMGVVMPLKRMEDIVNTGQYVLKFIAAAGANRFFVTYVVQIDFDSALPDNFSKVRMEAMRGTVTNRDVPGIIDDNGAPCPDFLEKSSLRWFLARDVLDVALRARWNHPVSGIPGAPVFRRPFLSGLCGLLQYFNLERFLSDLVWCSRTEFA